LAIPATIGCGPFARSRPELHSLESAGSGRQRQSVPALALNELQAGSFPPTIGSPPKPAVALIPLNDPMAEVNGKPSLTKVNLYRRGVDQQWAATAAEASDTTYCANFRAIHPTRLALDKPFLEVRPSPFPNLANSLFTFMVQRENASYVLLGCEALLGPPDRITPDQ
jgi:hypothetical protein